MSGELNTSILNRVAMLIFGRQAGANAEPQPVLLSEDRELAIVARLTGGAAAEVLEPTTPQVLTSVSTTYFTATKLTKIFVELVNSLNFDGATALVTYSVNAGDPEKVMVPSATPVPMGVGIRVGEYFLNPGGTVRASCSPPQSVTIHPIPYRIES